MLNSLEAKCFNIRMHLTEDMCEYVYRHIQAYKQLYINPHTNIA